MTFSYNSLRSNKFLRVFRTSSLLIVALFFTGTAFCQTPGTGTWNVLNVKKTFDPKWSAFFESQLRSQKLFNNFSYHELKAGIGYNIGTKLSIVVAAGQYVTYDPTGNFKSPVATHEFRFWQQFTLTNNIDPFKLEHRYRIEQRWINGNYRNRFRYRLNGLLPINKKKIENHTLYASVYDEVFFTNEDPYFERNRVYAGLGYNFNKLFTLQIGWIRQYDLKVAAPNVGKNYLQTNLFFSIGEHKSKREKHPSSDD
jgi:hypothetical protein